MIVEVDRDVCIGAGQCVVAASRVFGQDDEDGLVVLLRQPESADRADVGQAIAQCPSGAVRQRD
jgi:ferredoxin